ncbi:MAG TPA: HPr family phosphocarrier protein, partial [Sphingomicrobium sp.]|nr:HPr family phosphocarrier protein [Sphingomicrobium sp.]
MTACSKTIEITNKRGLHARASAKFVNVASVLPA